MRQRNATDPTDGCQRCSVASVCTTHEQYATDTRPTTATLLAGVNRGQNTARGAWWRVVGGGSVDSPPPRD